MEAKMRILKGGIAFFDSGVGGLTVLLECQKRLPNEIFYYFGDNRHAPYGNRSPKTIQKWVGRAVKKLLRYQIKALVLACNTATAVCVEDLRKKYGFPIIGAEPAVLKAVKAGNTVFVLSTRATYQSERFQKLCEKAKKREPTSNVVAYPCDALAGAIEKSIFKSDENFASLLPKGSPDAVVLGCTHYIYIKEQIQRFYGCEVFDGNKGIAQRLETKLSAEKEKDRDGRPPVTPPKNRSPKKEKTPPEKPLVFFLGSRKKQNKRLFEQMFAKCRK